VGVTDQAYVELFVADADAAANAYVDRFGFRRYAVSGQGTGLPDRKTWVLRQGKVELRLTSPRKNTGEVADFVAKHGEGVRDIALYVKGLPALYERALACGAVAVRAPHTVFRNGQPVTVATVGVMGDVVHTLIEDHPSVRSLETEGFTLSLPQLPRPRMVLSTLDHVAFCLEPGTLEPLVTFYRRAFGFEEVHREVVQTRYSGMNSKVVEGAGGAVRFPLQEPLAGTEEAGQIQKFLQRNEGPGVQHLAFHTDDILQSLGDLDQRGVGFLPTPGQYYEGLGARVGEVMEDLNALQARGVLVDRDAWGYLLQVFSKSVHPRGTLFFEVIQRRNARGFGGANVRALFEAVERAG
jgi:4-hydroxymandelate synthase